MKGPIGIFDSGYGGLTVFRSIAARLPAYDYLYLGDNARAPYGARSFETVHRYTREAVEWLFGQGCPLVILACNTASAKALRTIQQKDLPRMGPANRVLGVIRPTAEVIGRYTSTGHVGILATTGTVRSGSYLLEIARAFPSLTVHQQACPMWVPLVETGAYGGGGADFFIRECTDALMAQSPQIDAVLLACTHFPILRSAIEARLPAQVRVIEQGPIVAESLADYLHRHPEMEVRLSKGEGMGGRFFHTTDDVAEFERQAAVFYGAPVRALQTNLDGRLQD